MEGLGDAGNDPVLGFVGVRMVKPRITIDGRALAQMPSEVVLRVPLPIVRRPAAQKPRVRTLRLALRLALNSCGSNSRFRAAGWRRRALGAQVENARRARSRPARSSLAHRPAQTVDATRRFARRTRFDSQLMNAQQSASCVLRTGSCASEADARPRRPCPSGTPSSWRTPQRARARPPAGRRALRPRGGRPGHGLPRPKPSCSPSPWRGGPHRKPKPTLTLCDTARS